MMLPSCVMFSIYDKDMSYNERWSRGGSSLATENRRVGLGARGAHAPAPASFPTTCIFPPLSLGGWRGWSEVLLSQSGFIFCGLGGQDWDNLLHRPKSEGLRGLSLRPLRSRLTSWGCICLLGGINSSLGTGSSYRETFDPIVALDLLDLYPP